MLPSVIRMQRFRSDLRVPLAASAAAAWRPPRRLASSLGAAPPPAAQADGRNFHVEGGGWGHGVGMSQYGAYGRAQAGQSAEQILGFYYNGAQVQPLPMPSGIRIWMGESDGGNGVVVTAGSPNHVRPSRRPASSVRPRPVSRPASRSRTARCGSPTTSCRASTASGSTSIRPHRSRRRHRGCSFGRGRLEVILLGNGGLRVVVSNLDMQSYLYGLAEVPSSWPSEVLRAQAIAGRSYAADKIARSGLDRPDCSCSLVGTQGDQVYVGMDKELGPFGASWVAAVDSTDSLIATYGGAIVQAFYSSSNGGHTEASQDGFVSALPYLIAQPDPYDSVGPDYRWTRDYSQDGAVPLAGRRVRHERRDRAAGAGARTADAGPGGSAGSSPTAAAASSSPARPAPGRCRASGSRTWSTTACWARAGATGARSSRRCSPSTASPPTTPVSAVGSWWRRPATSGA